MWLDESAPIRKQDLILSKPFVNAPGTLGFVPDLHAAPAVEYLGAFMTHPISMRPRKPARDRACLPFLGGFLMHTGLPNPGIRQAVRQFERCWAAAPLPVMVHLMVEDSESLTQMVRKLEGLENLAALVLGFEAASNPEKLLGGMRAAVGELPVIPAIVPEAVPLLLPALIAVDPVAIFLAVPRGALPDSEGRLIAGRLYGPAIFPLMLQAARILTGAGLAVITGGGVYDPSQADALLALGVIGVGLGGVLWGLDPEALFGG